MLRARPGEGGPMSSRTWGAHESPPLDRLNAFSRRLAAESDLGSVLRDLLQEARRQTGAERGFFLFRRDGVVTCEAAVEEDAAANAPKAPEQAPPFGLSASLLERAFARGEALL